MSQDIKTPSSGSSGGSSAGGYTPAGAGSDYYASRIMSQEDQDLLHSYGANWNAATTQEEKDYWHDQAEILRNSYGYRGGEDGSEYIELMRKQDQAIPAKGEYDLSEYLRKAYASQLEAQLAGLKVAYEKSMAGYDDQEARLPQQYDAARNNVAAQDALARKAFDERAAASGLSSGAAGQAELARSSAYQRDIANLDQAKANALSDIQLAKTNLKYQYESAIAEARASGNSTLATALYKELVRVQGLEREDDQLAAAQEAADLELALKYGLYTGVGDTAAAETPAPAGSAASTSTNTSRSGKGYDNGGLTAQQIKAMQAYYGVTKDGLWGPNSQKAAGGLSAQQAWEKYQQENGTTGGSFWTGYGGTGSGNQTSLDYDPDEGVFVWAGKAYYDVNALLNAIESANLTASQKEKLKTKFKACGFDISFN
ncbi:hypothetical protein I6E42_11625 [Pseudoflavonifractor phocaeensis]|nr:hypothetical protein [Pseudoflavonifractor phocaeensis]